MTVSCRVMVISLIIYIGEGLIHSGICPIPVQACNLIAVDDTWVPPTTLFTLAVFDYCFNFKRQILILIPKECAELTRMFVATKSMKLCRVNVTDENDYLLYERVLY